MKGTATLLAALAVAFASFAATVRTATETFVTNKIAEAVAGLGAPDYSTNNTELVETIEAIAPVSGDHAETDPAWSEWADANTNRLGYVSHVEEAETALSAEYAEQAGSAIEAQTAGTATYADTAGFATNAVFADGAANAWNADVADTAGGLIFGNSTIKGNNIIQMDAAVAKAATNYTDSAVATRTTPEGVTNIVRDLSLGGIWDEQIQVWWTPRMRNGSLTYEATTNVNLNAED